MDRYIRSIQLPGFGEEAQRRLSQSKILIVGAGALGSVVAAYLAGAGVGRIVVADFDTVDITNLQRQPLFAMADIGKYKAERVANHIRNLNPEVEVKSVVQTINKENIAELLEDVDMAIEASDNPATKYLVVQVCERLGVPHVLGGVAQYRGQVFVWHPHCTSYTAIFPEEAPRESWKSAKEGGVFAPTAGIIAILQASEAIKSLAKIDHIEKVDIQAKLITYDALSATSNTFEL